MAKATLDSDFRIVMIGKNQEEKAKLGTFLTVKSVVPYGKLPKQSSVFCGEWRNAAVKVYNTSDLFSADNSKVREEVQRLLCESDPGPNAFLLLIDPSDFTRTDRDKLRSVLRSFGEDTFKSSVMIVTSNDMGRNQHFIALKQDCGQRLIRVDFNNLFGLLQMNLMDQVQDLVSNNQSEPFGGQMEGTIQSEHSYDYPKVVLNMVMCGGLSYWKTLAVKAILGKKKGPSKLSKSVKHVGTVGRRTVSIVELSALSSLTPDAAKEESRRCFSLCDPEGIHAFVFVQPVGPLNPEDKHELDVIRREFTSKMNAFKMVLFTVDSESGALAVSNFIRSNKDLQELCESCNNRHIILNISDKKQVEDVIRMVEDISDYGSKSFRKSEAEPEVRQSLMIYNKKTSFIPNPVKESLRIVVIGKTGSGKSATANTILGRDEFESKTSLTSVTQLCRKAEGQVEGRSVVIVDTPGLFDTTLSNAEVQEELVKCVSLLAPGPHVFLLVLELGRFTQEERETVHLIQNFFGDKSDKYTIFLFTRGDLLTNTTIEEYLRGGPTVEMLQKCGNRYHIFNNKDKENRKQVHELLGKIDAMVEQNGGGYYTSEIFQEAEKAIEKETERILQQRAPAIEKLKCNIEEKHKNVIKNTKRKIAAIKKTFEQDLLQRQKQVQEKQKRVAIEQKKRKEFEERKKDEEQLLKMEEEQQVQKWNERYKNLLNQTNDGRLRRMSVVLEEFQKEKMAWCQQRELLMITSEKEEQKRQEKNTEFEMLESEYEEAKQLYKAKLREDELRHKQEEEEFKVAEESYRKQLEAVNRRSFQEAREQAELCNDFQAKYVQKIRDDKTELEKQLEQMKEKQRASDKCVLKQLKRRKTHRKDYDQMLERQRQEMRALGRLQSIEDSDFLLRGVEELRKQHVEEVHDWIQDKVRNAADSTACSIL